MDAKLPAPAGHDNHDAIIAPILTIGPSFRIWAVALAGVVAWALFAWTWQLTHGLGVTNLGRPVYWGLYITNFVFFVGVSHAGTLISAILRIVQAEWRRPITRMAEVITVLVLFFGVGNILLDLGRPDRALNVLLHPHLRSPLIWDVSSITVYLTCSSIYLYLPLIPDIAIMRDRTTGWRHVFYRRLSIGWTGAPQQWHRLERTISIMAVGVIPVAVSVHTVVSWVFGMTIQPMWHSSIFGPYFVVGAIFSGIAAIITAMVIVRKVYALERYLQPIHFNNLGLLLLVMACLWLYFTFAEHLTTWYAQEPNELNVFNAKLFGRFAPLFWAMLMFCFVVPFTILANPRTRTIAGTLIASISVNIGMWLERFTIVVPSLSNPRAPVHTFIYWPSWVEWSLMAGCFAAFGLLYMGFTKLFPIISIWELPPDGAEPPPENGRLADLVAGHAAARTGHAPASPLPGMARSTLGLVLILAALPGRAAAQEPSTVVSVALPDRPTAGARVFLQKGCGRCHSLAGPTAAGSMIGPDLGRLLVSRTVMDLAGAFWNHAPTMRDKMQELKMTPPALTRDDIADIFVLLTAYRYYQTELDRPGDAAAGRRVFEGKGCAGCHDEDLRTGIRVGPGLQKYRGRSSAMFLAQAMWNHSAEMAEAMRARSLPWPKFVASEMDDLIAYLQHEGAGAPDQAQYFNSGSPRRGQEVFADKQCLACHSVNGTGGRGGPDLGTRTGTLVASVPTIASVMWNHSPPMAAEFERRRIPRVNFSGQEMVDVIAYLYFVNYTNVRGVPSRGARIFANKCAACHANQPSGGTAPDLMAIARFEEPFALIAAMWNHAPMMSLELEKRSLSWPRLEAGEAADLAVFLLSRRTGAPPASVPR